MPKKMGDHTKGHEGVINATRVQGNVYMIGPYGNRVSFQSQQIRALNLVWALWENHGRDLEGKKVAVVGAGVTGMTAAAGLMKLNADVTIYDSRSETSIQIKDARHRFIHPNINFFPSEALSHTTDLPFMNWWADQCNNVIERISTSFSDIQKKSKSAQKEIIYKEVVDVQIDTSTNSVEVYTRHQKKEREHQLHDRYEMAVLCTGFGKEKGLTGMPESPSYWQARSSAARLKGATVIVCGGGDGGIIDALWYAFDLEGNDIYEAALELCVHHDIAKKKRISLCKNCHGSENGKCSQFSDITSPKIEGLRKCEEWTTIFVELANKNSRASCFHRFLINRIKANNAIETRKTNPVCIRNEENAISSIEINKEQFEPSTTHVIVRHGAENDVALIPEEKQNIWKTIERTSSHFMQKPLWTQGDSASNPWKNERPIPMGSADLHDRHMAAQSWLEHYSNASGMQMLLTSVAVDGQKLIVFATGNLPNRNCGLPHIFGIPVEIESPEAARGGLGCA